MFNLSVGVGELIARPTIVYFFLFVALRWIGKKHVGELAPFDLLVLLIISETVQNAMIGNDKSLIGGLICAGTLLALTQAMNWLSWSNKSISGIIEGRPRVLVSHGTKLNDVLKAEKITISELMEALRHNGITNILDVRFAILENDGKISVIRR